MSGYYSATHVQDKAMLEQDEGKLKQDKAMLKQDKTMHVHAHARQCNARAYVGGMKRLL